MNGDNLLNFSRSDQSPNLSIARFEQDLSTVENAIDKEPVLGLIVALLLSLGLWAIIWVAVVALVGNPPI